MSEQEYDLEKSTSKVGQLIPRILAKDGTLLDGKHRGEQWRTEVLEHIDTEEKKLLARAIVNWHRRAVPRHEKEEWINGLAKIYKNQGYETAKVRPLGGYENEIVNKIAEETGLHRDTVTDYIDKKYKQKPVGGWQEETTRLPASRRIETDLGAEYVERHRQEVIEEEKERIKTEVKKEVKQDLKKDPKFRAEVVKEERERIVSGIKKDYPSNRLYVHGPRYYRNVVNTFYRIRGWGIPMVLSMGRETWNKTLPYVQGIHDWSGFLLSIKPDKTDDSIKAPKLTVLVDNRKIVEAEYQIVEVE